MQLSAAHTAKRLFCAACLLCVVVTLRGLQARGRSLARELGWCIWDCSAGWTMNCLSLLEFTCHSEQSVSMSVHMLKLSGHCPCTSDYSYHDHDHDFEMTAGLHLCIHVLLATQASQCRQILGHVVAAQLLSDSVMSE